MTKTVLRTTALLSTLLAVFAIGVPTARADHFNTMHSQARTLESNAERVEREVNYHFSNLPFTAALKSDVAEMARLADHIHDLTDDHASPRHIQADLRVLDAKFHDIEEVVATLQRLASGRGECRHARPSEYHVRRLSDRVQEMGRTLHSMQDTLALMLRECERPVVVHDHYIPVVTHRPVYRLPPVSCDHFDRHHPPVPSPRSSSHFSFSIRLK